MNSTLFPDRILYPTSSIYATIIYKDTQVRALSPTKRLYDFTPGKGAAYEFYRRNQKYY